MLIATTVILQTLRDYKHKTNRLKPSKKIWDTASFPLKSAHFYYPLHSTPNQKLFPLHCI